MEDTQRFETVRRSSPFAYLSHPLVSIVVALYSLILLYFPRVFVDLVFSPVVILTGILLFILLRVGSNQRAYENQVPDKNLECVSYEKEKESEPKGETLVVCPPEQSFPNCFVEWDVRAPLEVIYEGYEGQDEDEAHNYNDKEDNHNHVDAAVSFNRLASLSRYYPAVDDMGSSSSSSDNDGDFRVMEGWDDSPSFRWDEEDKEGLIEIELGDHGYSKKSTTHNNSCEFVQGEEDNLIEIDICSPTGSPMEWRDFPGIDVRFSLSSP